MNQNKSTQSAFIGLSILAAALTGCKSKCPHAQDRSDIKRAGPHILHHGSIAVSLPEETLSVLEGSKVDFTVQPAPNDFQFQWQKNESPIDGETHRHYALPKVELKNVGTYRCMIYNTGEFGETNYTTKIALGVTGKSLLQSLVPVPTAGTLQPGTWVNNKSTNCWCEHTGYARFKSPLSNSYWWSPKSPAPATLTDSSNNAPTSNHRIDVMESGSLQHWCDTNGVVSFPVKSTCKYQFMVYVINTALPSDPPGETITLQVDGLK